VLTDPAYSVKSIVLPEGVEEGVGVGEGPGLGDVDAVGVGETEGVGVGLEEGLEGKVSS
jgi:hypothetical protein